VGDEGVGVGRCLVLKSALFKILWRISTLLAQLISQDLSSSISDVSWSKFVEFLKYKSEWMDLSLLPYRSR